VAPEKKMVGRYLKCPCCSEVMYYDWKTYTKPSAEEIKKWKEVNRTVRTPERVECVLDMSIPTTSNEGVGTTPPNSSDERNTSSQ
jgi:hypothetical protein